MYIYILEKFLIKICEKLMNVFNIYVHIFLVSYYKIRDHPVFISSINIYDLIIFV